MGGLEIDRHDELPLVSTGTCTPEEREAAEAYVRRNARDDTDRDLLLAALGLARHPAVFLTTLTVASTGLLALGWRLTHGGPDE